MILLIFNSMNLCIHVVYNNNKIYEQRDRKYRSELMNIGMTHKSDTDIYVYMYFVFRIIIFYLLFNKFLYYYSFILILNMFQKSNNYICLKVLANFNGTFNLIMSLY